jgi:hypothetical protein
MAVHVPLELVAVEEKILADGAHAVGGDVVLEKTAMRCGTPLTWFAIEMVMLEMVVERRKGLKIRFVSTEMAKIVVEGALDVSTQAGGG